MPIVFDVLGMRSDDCCRRIQEAISAKDPDAVVVAMRGAGRLSIDSTLEPEDLAATVKQAGYAAAFAFKA